MREVEKSEKVTQVKKYLHYDKNQAKSKDILYVEWEGNYKRFDEAVCHCVMEPGNVLWKWKGHLDWESRENLNFIVLGCFGMFKCIVMLHA